MARTLRTLFIVETVHPMLEKRLLRWLERNAIPPATGYSVGRIEAPEEVSVMAQLVAQLQPPQKPDEGFTSKKGQVN